MLFFRTFYLLNNLEKNISGFPQKILNSKNIGNNTFSTLRKIRTIINIWAPVIINNWAPNHYNNIISEESCDTLPLNK